MVERLLAEPARLDELARAGRAAVCSGFTAQAMADRMLEVFAEATNRSGDTKAASSGR
jgi:hypothetical protein